MKSDLGLIEAFAEAWAEGALASARMMEASTKTAMSAAEDGPSSPASSWYRHPDTPDPFASMSDAMQAMANSGLAWWSPEFWSSMKKRSPSALQTLAEPAFGSFVGLDPFSPLLVWEHIIPDLASPAGWSPANVFNPTNWMKSFEGDRPNSWFGMPIPSEALSGLTDLSARQDLAGRMMKQWWGGGSGSAPGLPWMMPVSNPWLDAVLPTGSQSMSTLFATPPKSGADMMGLWQDGLTAWARMVEQAPALAGTPAQNIGMPAMWLNNVLPFSSEEGIKVFVASVSFPRSFFGR